MKTCSAMLPGTGQRPSDGGTNMARIITIMPERKYGKTMKIIDLQMKITQVGS